MLDSRFSEAAGGRADTTPDCQEPPDREIDAAQRDIPRTLNAMTNCEGCANPVPLRGHRLVRCTQLVDELCKRNHPADAAKWAIHRLIQDGMLQAEFCHPGVAFTIGRQRGEVSMGNPTPVVPSGPVALDELLVRSTDALWAWHQKGQEANQGADAAHDQGGAGQGEGTGKGRPAGGRKQLEESNPMKLQVYQRIQKEHDADKRSKTILARLRSDKDFKEQVNSAGLKLTKNLIRSAIAFFAERRRQEVRKNQETDPA